MSIDPAIFKAYDIRGVVPSQLNEEIAYAIGRAFVVWLAGQRDPAPTIVVARDGRISGPSLFEAVKQGLADQGASVIDVGVLASEQFYFACAYVGAPGVTVTASHNPKEYNGMKFVKKIPFFLSGDQGIQELRTLVEQSQWPEVSKKGTVRTEDIRSLYVEKLFSIIPTSDLRPPTSRPQPPTVVIDTANGVAGPIITDIASALPVTVRHLFADVDGAFPNHPADPLRPENRIAAQQAIHNHKAQAGFLFDGDGDRCFVLDENGELVPNEFLGTLFAQDLLSAHPGATFIYDVRSSWAFPRVVEAAGGKPFMNRVGHAYIKPRMMEEGAVYGMEVSGHHYFKDFFWCDSGVLPMLYTLKIMSKTGKSLSELVAPLRQQYHLSGELNYAVHDAPGILKRLKEKLADAPKKYELDGVSFEYPDWHCNVRSSNTEPLLRLNLESMVSKEHMEERKKEMESIILEPITSSL
ncbi:phosphomannomutase/phosphoglucomutase [Candidatus Uhrbacteria bacterium]|nr:phosphomannomutase/phosphoglucomutase [Candidatus Uhrbacteria bacterium]